MSESQKYLVFLVLLCYYLLLSLAMLLLPLLTNILSQWEVGSAKLALTQQEV